MQCIRDGGVFQPISSKRASMHAYTREPPFPPFRKGRRGVCSTEREFKARGGDRGEERGSAAAAAAAAADRQNR